jgi:hypothetical protein
MTRLIIGKTRIAMSIMNLLFTLALSQTGRMKGRNLENDQTFPNVTMKRNSTAPLRAEVSVYVYCGDS